ncbi:hypothetical protein [Paenibacillus tuaregi]|uniref:hypothetical protein n=1 Tax=Paenibacillus tuaregi TaxID=1816681 RepID=UPI00083802A0|nr:hypothetical protein [Paenibacillus tuaregi]
MLRRKPPYPGIVSAALLTLGVLLLILWGSLYEVPHAYRYVRAQAPNGVQLHALAAKPEEITLKALAGPLSAYPEYGINGGFFYGADLLSIAVMNDRPVKGDPGKYGSGWFNVKYPRGTLVWDGAAGTFSVQVVSSASEIQVSDRRRYFAQGGVSMNLQEDSRWPVAAKQENLPFGDEKRLRSGLVYDQSGTVWLIVTPTHCTAAEFRAAIQGSLAPDLVKEGIFLDGDGSAQLNAAEARLTGDSRSLFQMIVVR